MLLTPVQDTAINSTAPSICPPTGESLRAWPKRLLLVLLALLIAAPASTKVAGAAWLLIGLIGLWAVLRIPVVRSVNSALVQSSLVWLSACFLAFALQAVVTYYWADPWGDRHVEVRLLLGAAATFALVRRLCLSPQQKTWLTHALALACWVALGISYMYGRETPSNAIPWAAGVSFFVCLLLPLSMQSHVTGWRRGAWSVSVLAGVAAVLLSQSRGSYGLVLWLVLFAGIAAVTQLIQRRRSMGKAWSRGAASRLGNAVVAVSLLVLVLVSFPRIHQEPLARVQQAWSEIKEMSAPSLPQAQVINSSVGARLYMWRMAFKEIREAPLLGHGSKARIAWIHRLGESSGSDAIKSLDHLHSDLLTTVFDHGLLGLLSYLSLGVALAWIALRSKLYDARLRWSVAGVLWMHLSSGLTNTNFGHNYYGVMLALSLALAWMLSTDETKEA
ncbi:MAG: O-antigen ligase family protein [Polaromonas sp.]|jgi:O-antigen ligase|nr:O-antigen ligase family protein [Polaromonas sp.]